MHYTFYDNATAVLPSIDMNVGDLDTVLVQIWGSSTSRTILFKASVTDDKFVDIMGLDMSTLAPSISTTSTDKVFQFDVRGIDKLRMVLAAVAGGNVYIKAHGIKHSRG